MTPQEAIARAQGLVGQVDRRGEFLWDEIRKEGGDDVRRQCVAAEAVGILTADHAATRYAYLRAACQLEAKQEVHEGGTILEGVLRGMERWRLNGPKGA